jgi:hypothetical protein
MTDDLHEQAVLARLTDGITPALVVFDGRVPDGALPPYVVVWFARLMPESYARPDSASLRMVSDRVVLTVTTHSVHVNAQACRAIAGRVRDALLDYVPGISGRTCLPIRHVDGQPIQLDEMTGTPIYDIADMWRLETLPG